MRYLTGGLAALLLSSMALADGTEQLGPPSIDIADGTGVVVAGVGLAESQPGTINIDVPADATVTQVLLYIEGSFAVPGESTPAMAVQVNGADVEATRIGGPTQRTSKITASYRADITALGAVVPGANNVQVGGLDFTADNDGAGLLVIYDDGTGTKSLIDIRDGNDWLFINLQGSLAVSEPQVYSFKSSKKPRVALVDLFVGSVAGGAGSGNICRPASFELTTNGPQGETAVFSDLLDSEDGLFWDTVSLAVTVFPGTTELKVELFSRDDKVECPGNLPASMAWVASGLNLLQPPPDNCWITTGGFHNAGATSGSKDFTFGGNVGPPPRGSWEVIDHLTGDNFHAFDVSIVNCETIQLTGPDQPGGKKGFTINQASFEGTGRLNFVGGYPFTGYVQDAGEPAGKNGNNSDYFSITVRDPVTNEVVFEASAPLDGGNVQIHPPTGRFK